VKLRNETLRKTGSISCSLFFVFLNWYIFQKRRGKTFFIPEIYLEMKKEEEEKLQKIKFA
jgi:hypothetical protein